MSSFSSQIRGFIKKVDARRRDVFVGTVTAVKGSLVEGSSITGAPGQPVDTGTLRNSFHESFEGPTTASITTNVAYAGEIEDGARADRALTLRSKVGGFHSVKLTRAGFQALVDDVAKGVVHD